MERNEELERVMRSEHERLQNEMDEERRFQEGYYYPRIDAALAENDEETAMDLVMGIPDIVTRAFGLDRIREWKKSEG